MAAQTATPSERFNFGPLVARQYTLTSVNNGDTLLVPLIRVLSVDVQPTTATAVGFTSAAATGGTTITFVSGGNFAANVFVIGREG